MGSGRLDKDIQVLVNKGRERGWTVTKTKDQHLRWVGPNGEGPVVTSSRRQNVRRIIATLKRFGLDLEGPILPNTSIGRALEDALRKKEKVRIEPRDLGEGRPECEASEVIIRHPKGSGQRSIEVAEQQQRQSGQQAKVLMYLQDHADKIVTIAQLAKHMSGDPNRVATIAARLASNPGIPVERVGRGLYRYNNNGRHTPTPEVQPEVQPEDKAKEIATVPSSIVPPPENIMLLEVIKTLSDNRLLVQDENGNLYTLKPLEV